MTPFSDVAIIDFPKSNHLVFDILSLLGINIDLTGSVPFFFVNKSENLYNHIQQK